MGETYTVNCYICESGFDALGAAWCTCMVTERSLICPRCLTCFCAAPLGYKRQFWAGAPLALWESRRREHASELRLGPNPSPADARRPLVLLVEDDRALHWIIARAAVSSGCGFIRAEDGRAGLRLAQLYRPELIITDALMPHLDGRELCRQIKQDRTTAAAKVVIMTGVYRSPTHAKQALATTGADDYVIKPIPFAALQELIRRHAGPAAQPKELRQHPRFEAVLTFRLVRLQAGEGEPREETTQTEIIGRGGCQLVTSLPIGRDELVQLEAPGKEFRTRASVRNVFIGADGRPRLSLWFLDAELPDALLPPQASP